VVVGPTVFFFEIGILSRLKITVRIAIVLKPAYVVYFLERLESDFFLL
jgi:hypothetical protein